MEKQRRVTVFAPRLPDRLLGDKAHDSDDLVQKIIEKYGIEMIAPHKGNRKKEVTQDMRRLRRLKKKMES